MIEGVEEFHAELQVTRLGKMEVLHQRKIRVEVPRAANNIASRIPKSPLRWQSKAAGIEPIGRSMRRIAVRVADEVRACLGCAGIRVIIIDYRGEVIPGSPTPD